MNKYHFRAARSFLLVTVAIWSFVGARRLDLAKLDFKLVQPFDTERYTTDLTDDHTLKSFTFSPIHIAFPLGLPALRAAGLVHDGTFDSEFTPLNDFRWSLLMMWNIPPTVFPK